MAAAQLAMNELMTSDELASSEIKRAKVEVFRERLRHHLAGDALPSNYEAMCEVIREGLEPCPACSGRGYRLLPPDVDDEFKDREERRLAEMAQLERQVAEPVRQRGDELGEQRARDIDAVYDKIVKLGRIRERQGWWREKASDRGKRHQRSICQTCKGSRFAPRRHDGEGARPDGMFSTVGCPACRGVDARQHPRLLARHYGSSTGVARMRGARPDADGFPVPHPKDEAAAERGDVCERCGGDAYLEPINVRPTLKTSQIHENPEGVGDYDPERDGVASDQPAPAIQTSDPSEFLHALERDDPELAAAVAILNGEHAETFAGHAWGKRFAIWPLLAPGRELGSRSRLASDKPTRYERLLDLCEREYLAEAQAETGKGDPRRRQLLQQADDQARRLEARAERALRQAGVG